MFTVYGITGQVFSGTLEAMNRVYPMSSARNARGIAKEGDEIGVETTTSPLQREAISAYRRMLPEDLERGPLIHAAQIMSHPVISVQQSDPVADAWRVLRQRGIHQAPVLDEAQRLVGVVNERDLLTAIDIDGDRILETLKRQVRDVMTSPVVAAATVTDIRRIAAVMLEGGFSAIPILNDKGRIVGIISRTDVLRAVMTDPPLSLWR
ncbi:MAG: CBS domain-containing protein [Gammaproteobacteria bacterium]|nr:CBS domain-containing protein [Gammaproteobacteria bacterium]